MSEIFCKLRTGALPAMLFCLMLSTTGAAQMRQQSSHEHGRSSMNIAVEGPIVAVEILGPMANFVGFEHEPSNDQEHQALAGARAIIETPASLLEFDPRANCVPQSVQADFPDVDEHGEHEDDHEDEAHDHLEITATYTFECADPERISRVRVALFEQFPSTEVVEVNVLSDTGVTSTELTPDATELLLN